MPCPNYSSTGIRACWQTDTAPTHQATGGITSHTRASPAVTRFPSTAGLLSSQRQGPERAREHPARRRDHGPGPNQAGTRTLETQNSTQWVHVLCCLALFLLARLSMSNMFAKSVEQKEGEDRGVTVASQILGTPSSTLWHPPPMRPH